MEEKCPPSILERVEPWGVATIQFLVCYTILAGFLTLLSPFQERTPEHFLFCVGIAVPCATWIVRKSRAQQRQQKLVAEQNALSQIDSKQAD